MQLLLLLLALPRPLLQRCVLLLLCWCLVVGSMPRCLLLQRRAGPTRLLLLRRRGPVLQLGVLLLLLLLLRQG